jgi:hypothetical protein
MKKYIIYITTFILFINCSEDFFDVNVPSNTEDLNNLEMNELLSPAIYHTVNAYYLAERTLGNYTQQFTGQTGGASGATSLSGTWSEIYYNNLVNAKAIKEKATESGATHFEAIANILISMNIGLATDCWDNVPYSQAANAIMYQKPVFDTQQSIYTEIDALLSEAITALEGNDNGTEKISSESDLVFGGDTSKWLRLAYTLRAKYKMHLSEVNGTALATEALTYLAKGMSSNDDDFQLNYTTKNINPWYSRQILAASTGNDHDKIGSLLVNYMNGIDYPFTTISNDPRLPIYAAIDDGSTEWKGYVNGGDGLSYDGTSGNTDFADGGFYTNRTSPIVLVSYSEALFLKAEAEFLSNGGSSISLGSNTNAYNAYIDGITANMEKLGVSGANYISEASIGVGMTNLKLEHIMKEKYIANFLNPEIYVDFRRYNFSKDIFKNLELPADHLASEYPSSWLVRANYPASEEQGNSENVTANKKSPIEPVWWDQ